ncbi:nucleotidyl transferase AbiEii/AbiGii toxin family protein [Halorhodospira sp. 9622]|uniref:nucleotidyl transferase AbiEii/AbiGii toxin family protein n=1 Tax=Halorhodospira sp. 9622 TaxID=2899136 RepID=UPI001EE8F55B|nr:nucleotidyl transferase AbiEii/AbiGii toxin family protein [Halorhodospira sp. 9622]MCG5539222.1 nucleotidyl transferase AbiEii/AbiGii toxin family protein [Halorhodospira sp. 9622]
MELRQLTEAALAEITGGEVMRPVIEKELLHYDILRALEQSSLLGRLTFQGGTALRLCYGSARYSEDLDFVGGREFAASDLAELAEVIEAFIGKRYGLEVRVKEPPSPGTPSPSGGITVHRWQVALVTAPARPDIPKQRIRIEVTNVPAYSSELRALQRNYAALPDGYEDILVPVESIDEIMADKLLSLVANDQRIRHRDLWDLPWLQQQGISPSIEWLQFKIADYGVRDYEAKLARRRAELPSIIHGDAFREQMTRFIPPTVVRRTLERPGFLDYLQHTNQQLLDAVARGLTGGPEGPEFPM